MIPLKHNLMVNPETLEEFVAASLAQLQLNAIQFIISEELRYERKTTKAPQDTTQFLWGQDFDIEPDVWEEFDTKYT